MTSLLDVCVESSDGLVLRREVRIGETHDGETAFYGNDITVVDENGKDILYVHNRYGSEVSINKNTGEITILGKYATVTNGSKSLYVYDGETCIDPNHHSYPMSVVVSNGKTKDNTKTKANLNVTEDENIISLDGAVTVFKRGKANLSVIDGNACIDMANSSTSLEGKSIILKYGDYAEVFTTDAKVYIGNIKRTISFSGGNTDLKLGKKKLFVPNVKEADIDCINSAVYYNGKEICCMSQLKELWELSGVTE